MALKMLAAFYGPVTIFVQVVLHALAAATPLIEKRHGGPPEGVGNAGYETRPGPPGIHCVAEYYNITVTSNNTVFKNVDSKANTVSEAGPWRRRCIPLRFPLS